MFLSAVTQEFGELRTLLYHQLRRDGYAVQIQEQLVVGSGTLLDKLQHEICRCDVVVSIMGRQFGEPAPAVPATENVLRSYTQWEYEIACGRYPDGTTGPARNRVRALADDAVPLPTDPAPAGPPAPVPRRTPPWVLASDADEKTRLQHAFVRRWVDAGEDRAEFSRDNAHELLNKVSDAVRRMAPIPQSEPVPPNPWPARMAMAVVAVAVLLLTVDAFQDRPLVLIPPFAGGDGRQAAAQPLQDDLLKTLTTAGVRAQPRDPAWVPWPWSRPAVSIQGSQTPSPVHPGVLMLDVTAESSRSGHKNRLQVAFDAGTLEALRQHLPRWMLDRLGVVHAHGPVDVLPRPDMARGQQEAAVLLDLAQVLSGRDRSRAIAFLQDAVQRDKANEGAEKLLAELVGRTQASTGGEVIFKLPTASPTAGAVAQAITENSTGKPRGKAHFQQIDMPALKTRITIADFDRRAYTLELLQQSSDGAGLTIRHDQAGQKLFVVNAGFFERDKQTRRLLPAGQMIVNGTESVSPPPLNHLRGALTVGKDGALAILYRPGQGRPDFGDTTRVRHLLHAGPVLVEPDHVFGMRGTKHLLAPRLSLCIKKDRFVFVIVEWQRRPGRHDEFVGGMDLYDLAHVLTALEKNGGMHCQAAIALDGGWSTQYAYKRDDPKEAVSWPPDPVRVPTMLAVVPR